MATITIKINERTQEGKTFLELVNFFHSKNKSVEIVKEKSPYNPAFVKMVKKSQSQIKEGKFKTLNTDDVWGSLGL